jgi:hypothetical protein
MVISFLYIQVRRYVTWWYLFYFFIYISTVTWCYLCERVHVFTFVLEVNKLVRVCVFTGTFNVKNYVYICAQKQTNTLVHGDKSTEQQADVIQSLADARFEV